MSFGAKHALSNTVRILKFGKDLAKESLKNMFLPAEFPKATPAAAPEPLIYYILNNFCPIRIRA